MILPICLQKKIQKFDFYMQKSKFAKKKNFWEYRPGVRSVFHFCFFSKKAIKLRHMTLKKIWGGSLIFFTSTYSIFVPYCYVNFWEKGTQKKQGLTIFLIFLRKSLIFSSLTWFKFWRNFNFITFYIGKNIFPWKRCYHPRWPYLAKAISFLLYSPLEARVRVIRESSFMS